MFLLDPFFRGTTLATSLVAASLFATITASVDAQCELVWQPSGAVSGINGTIRAMVPTGSGAAVYVLGEFTIAGDTFVSNVAFWNGSSWSSMGNGTNGLVTDGVLMPNGDLIVAGLFDMAGGVPASNVARWDGTSWSALQQGLDNVVVDLLLLPNGDLVAAGSFQQSGPTPVSRFGLWDGVSWQQYAGPGFVGVASSIAVMPNGDFVAAGVVLLPGPSLPALGVWDGSNWTVQTTQSIPGVWITSDVLLMPSGELAISGTLPGGERFARWDGTNFQFETLPPNAHIRTMTTDASGDLIAVGGGNATSPQPVVLRRSNGVWTTELSLRYGLAAVAGVNGRLFVGGSAQTIQGSMSSVLIHDGTSWAPTSPSNAVVLSVAGGAGRSMYAGGEFDSIEGVPANNIARFDGTSWQAMAGGVNGPVRAVAVAPNGDVVVAGAFTAVSGVPANSIARWNGVSWSTLGGGLTNYPRDLAIGPNGEVVAVSSATLKVFGGNAWTTVPLPVGTQGLRSVAVLPTGDIVVAGSFMGSDVQTWDGTIWVGLGSVASFGDETELLVTPQGELFHAGRDISEFTVRRWDGASWQLVGSAFSDRIDDLDVLPTGQLIAAGDFTFPSPNRIAFWDGASWQSVDGGVGESYGSFNRVHDLAVNGAGEVFCASDYASMGSQVSPMLARASSNCPATSTVFGAGCVGQNGPMTLAPVSDPWLGTYVRSRATGFPQVAIAMHIIGTNNVVLPLPGGAPGCLQLLEPVLSDLFAPLQGAVETAVFVPNIPAIAGLSFRSQVVGLELNTSLMLTGVTSTNALDMTIGAY